VKSLNNLSISRKLLLCFLLIGLIPFTLLAVLAVFKASDSLSKQSYQQLESVREIKKKQMENFLAVSRRDALGLASVVQEFIQNGALDNVLVHADKDGKTLFDKYLDSYGYYDLFLIEPNGFISYTVAREADYQTSLSHGAYKDSNLGELYRKVITTGDYAAVDFAAYAPSAGAPAGFIGAPVVDDNGTLLKIVALQIPLDPINAIMGIREGMGDSGESYLVGQDYLMRSDSYLDQVNHTVEASFANPEKGSVKTNAVKQALAGMTGSELIIDYNGNPVLSSFTLIDVDGIQWALMVEVDEAEAFAAVTTLKLLVLLIALVGIVAISYAAWRIARGITEPVTALATTIGQVEATGDFSARLDVTSEDEIGDASKAVNNLLQAMQDALGDTKKVVARMAEGDFGGRVTRELRGDLNDLKNAINRSAEQTQTSIQQLGTLTSRLSAGEFDAECNAELAGEYRSMVNATQVAMQDIGNAVREVNEIMEAMAAGNFDLRINSDLPGQLGALKTNLNQSLDSIHEATEEVVNVANLQSQGNLVARVHGNYRGRFDELKRAINSGQTAISELVNEVRSASADVAGATNEISQGNNNLSDRTQEQAAAIEETSVSMTQISQAIRKTAANSGNANELARKAQSSTEEGAAVMSVAIQAMTGIQESSKRISEITGLIDSIAFQTNLLALNAAVEAARAGEHGRGFAVVASEVRSLSQKSAEAARNIKELIGNTTERIEEGTLQVTLSADALKEITNGIGEVSDMINEITLASREQAEGIDQVTSAVGSIDHTTQQNAALVEEISAAAESMRDKARSLNAMMDRFVTEDENRIGASSYNHAEDEMQLTTIA